MPNMTISLAAHSKLTGVKLETVSRLNVSRVVLETPTGTYEMWLDAENGRLNVMSVAPNTLVVLPQVTNVIQLQGDKPL